MSVGVESARLTAPRHSAPTDDTSPATHRLADRLRQDPLHTAVTVTLDFAAAAAAVEIATWWSAEYTSVQNETLLVWLFVPLVLLGLASGSMYRRSLRRNFLDEIGPVEAAVAVSALMLLTILLIVGNQTRPSVLVIPIWVSAAVLIAAVRLTRAVIQRFLRRRFKSASPTLVVGGGPLAHQLIARMYDMPDYGLRPVGILDATSSTRPPVEPSGLYPEVPYCGAPIDFADVARQLGVEDLIITPCDVAEDELVAMVRKAHRHDIRVWVVPRIHDAIGARARVDHIGGLPLLVLPQINPRGWQFAIKHAMDRILAGIALLILSPVMVTLALLVKFGPPGPIFFRQKRIGRNGKPFDCLKFRSMRPPRESDAAFELKGGAAPGGVEGVDRRTRVGKIMRATSLDELPQFINVLLGDMSLVGPRPERPEFVELFEMQIRRYGERHRVKAGVTGWAQVHGLRGQTSIADRAEWDNYYIENWSVWLDIKILFLTVLAVLKRAE
jgi:exopolysaccharide biosynthesis polyprenyl glycosylphosphotransferase